jgi:hypothetical protein
MEETKFRLLIHSEITLDLVLVSKFNWELDTYLTNI